MKKVTVVLIGAGDRGKNAYAPYALMHPDEVQFVGVVNRGKKRRDVFAQLHGIPEEARFATWDEFLAKPKMADAVIICLSDKLHYEVAKKAIEKGYHVMLEKPISTNPERVLELERLANATDQAFVLCYVLRYTPFYQKIKELLDDGKIGRLVSIQQHENIGYAHFAHSYVRGNWHNVKESCSMLLSKSCHDLDIFCWFTNSHCKEIQSFGSLSYFNEANAPEGAPRRCTDGCPHREECPYYAPELYSKENSGFASSIVADGGGLEERMEALRTGPYGVCVFHNDNDACDNQVVNMLFENGVTVSFSSNAFSYECNRNIRLYGTKGEIRGNLGENYLELHDFLSGSTERYDIKSWKDRHGGGDYGIMSDFVRMINESGKGKGLTSVRTAAESHLMAFAAEESRLTHRTINLKEYAESIKGRYGLDSE